ncbi:hypothetical protein ACF09J_35625 [Streptomyces sp. NPDC014889]|uniref:hypothetical protein n=1 Tax=Streptomyces sp. NPDC014889 TaxID=3364928 RepID=UPI0037002628
MGGNRLLTGSGFDHKNVHLVAYPGANPPPLTCTTTTRKETFSGWPGSYLRIDCDGYSGGSSGGPFIANFNEQTQTGDVIGGYMTGGPTNDTSYSSARTASAPKIPVSQPITKRLLSRYLSPCRWQGAERSGRPCLLRSTAVRPSACFRPLRPFLMDCRKEAC